MTDNFNINDDQKATIDRAIKLGLFDSQDKAIDAAITLLSGLTDLHDLTEDRMEVAFLSQGEETQFYMRREEDD